MATSTRTRSSTRSAPARYRLTQPGGSHGSQATSLELDPAHRLPGPGILRAPLIGPPPPSDSRDLRCGFAEARRRASRVVATDSAALLSPPVQPASMPLGIVRAVPVLAR